MHSTCIVCANPETEFQRNFFEIVEPDAQDDLIMFNTLPLLFGVIEILDHASLNM